MKRSTKAVESIHWYIFQRTRQHMYIWLLDKRGIPIDANEMPDVYAKLEVPSPIRGSQNKALQVVNEVEFASLQYNCSGAIGEGQARYYLMPTTDKTNLGFPTDPWNHHQPVALKSQLLYHNDSRADSPWYYRVGYGASSGVRYGGDVALSPG